jgi:hypothetical protein
LTGLPDRVLAYAATEHGWLAGTRAELVIAEGDDPRRVPWEVVEDADWDLDASRLTVREVGSYGEQRASYSFVVAEPGRLMELVRERVTASVVLQRRVSVHGRRGFAVIARRNPAGGPLRWMHEYDEGVDPADPEVARLAEAALRAARAEIGQE